MTSITPRVPAHTPSGSSSGVRLTTVRDPIDVKKDGTLSKMRSHAGNVPILPQTKVCPYQGCSAKFTRTTHLNRHLRTHTNERLHRCDLCDAHFTRSDLLTRHKKTCTEHFNRPRRKSCIPCTESKVKCDRQLPCSKCTSRGKECVFAPLSRRFAGHEIVSQERPEFGNSNVLLATGPDANVRSVSYQKTLVPHGNGSHEYSYDQHSSVASHSETATEMEDRVQTQSRLASLYHHNMFQGFLTDVLSLSPSVPPAREEVEQNAQESRSMSPDEFPFALNAFSNDIQLNGDEFNLAVDFAGLQHSSKDTILPGVSQSRTTLTLNIDNHDSYLNLFFVAFSAEMPIIHASTFTVEGKPEVLLDAMRACGALYVKSPEAVSFVTEVLASARDTLVSEFAKYPTNSTEVVHLILAVVLLQTIGLFHQQSEQRMSSSIYHTMLVMLIRRTELIRQNAAWKPLNSGDSSLEARWADWVLHEMTKRALILSYLHDCCHCIYFALPPSYHPSEILLHLPCDGGLWKATSAAEWESILSQPSQYNLTTEARLSGSNMPRTLAEISQPRLLQEPIYLSPFAHFVLTHAILRHIFNVCLESRLPKTLNATLVPQETIQQELLGLQYIMHNWLECWLSCPDPPEVDNGQEPPFFEHALPFYWLGQVALLAYQEGLPPFEAHSNNNLKMESRFRLVKRWLKYIREFLRQSDEAPTLCWDELMKIRLQTWQGEVESDSSEDREGLLGFFANQ